MRRFGVVLAVAVLGACAAVRADRGTPELPQGWRLPTATETADEWRAESLTRYVDARGDFDGDGRTDRALLLIHRERGGVGLFAILRGGPPRVHQLYELHSPHTIAAWGIDVARAGRQRVLCDDDGPCGRDGKKRFWLDHPAVLSFRQESAASLFYWDPVERGFDQVWISD